MKERAGEKNSCPSLSSRRVTKQHCKSNDIFLSTNFISVSLEEEEEEEEEEDANFTAEMVMCKLWPHLLTITSRLPFHLLSQIDFQSQKVEVLCSGQIRFSGSVEYYYRQAGLCFVT